MSTKDAYVTVDGTVPSSTNGLPLLAAQGAAYFPLQGAHPVKVIEAEATATLRGVWVA